MKILTVENVAKACNGTLVNAEGFEQKELQGAAIDSRKVEKDNIFFAFKGEKADGHDYIKAAFDNGAALVVCERVPEGEEGVCVVVENTLEALKDIARFYRDELKIKVVGVTGSIGKTTTKEFIATVLAQKYSVFRTDKNQNNLIGLPLSILNISESNEVAVLEMGISEFGEMTTLSGIAKPDICVITNISECHLETLSSLDGVFKAKTEIFEHMNPEGSIVVCGDDERLLGIKEVNGKAPITYGLNDYNDVHPVKVTNRGLWGSECNIENGEGMFSVSIPLPGKHMINDALAAVSVARILEVSPEQVSFGISCMKAVKGRNNLIQKNGITIIDDCYNASPESMKSALDLLTEAITPTVAILGDMYEQGENEEKSHEEIGEYAVSKGINTIVCVGEISKKMYEKAMVAAGVKEDTEVIYYQSVDETIDNLSSFIKKDDTVLLKASNGMKFDRILEALVSDDNKDAFVSRDEKLFKKDNIPTEDTLIGSIKETKTETAETPVSETAPKEEKPVKAKKEKTADEKEKAGAKKQLMLIIAAVLVVVIAGLAAFGIIRHNKYKDATDGQIVFLTNANYCTKGFLEDGVIVATKDSPVIDDRKDSELGIRYDGKYLYYAVPAGNGYELKRCNKSGNKATKIADGVIKYEVLSKGKIIFISNNNLYTAAAKKDEIQMVAEDVFEYHLNKKKNALVYRTYTGKLCYMKLNKAESLVTIDEDVNRIEFVREDLSDYVYVKTDGLYYGKLNKESKLVTSEFVEAYVAKKENKTKLYFRDRDDAVWYYEEGDKNPTMVTDDCVSLLGYEYELAAFIITSRDQTKSLLRDKTIYELKDFDQTNKNLRAAGASLKDNKLYFLCDDTNGNTNLCSVMFDTLGKKGKVFVESSNVAGAEYVEDGYVFTVKGDGAGNLDLYQNENLIARNVERGSLKKTEYGDDFVFTYQVSDADGFYKMVLYDGKNLKEIGSTIDLNYDVLSRKKVFYRTKGKSNMFDIKMYNGRKSKTYKENITTYYYLTY